MKKIALLVCFAVSMVASSALADIARFAKVADGIYRGGQPESAEDYQKLKDLGIKTIINLRSEEDLVKDESLMAKQLEIAFQNFPMNALDYPSEETVDGAIAALTNPELQPVFIHCHHGKDRTGLVIGLYRVQFEHWSQEAAWDEMVSFGFVKYLVGLTSYFYLHTTSVGNWF